MDLGMGRQKGGLSFLPQRDHRLLYGCSAENEREWEWRRAKKTRERDSMGIEESTVTRGLQMQRVSLCLRGRTVRNQVRIRN